MKNKYFRLNEMESSCEQMLYFENENKRMCNRFTTYKKHLRRKPTCVILIYLAISVLHYQSQNFVEGALSRSLIETPNLDYFKNEIQPEREAISIQGNAGDLYNELTISNENNAKIKDSSDFTTSNTYSHSKNFKLSVQNATNELLVLETLKKLPEPETRNDTKEIIHSKKDVFQTPQLMTRSNGTNYQLEDIINHHVLNNNLSLYKKNLSTSLRDSFNNYYNQIPQNYIGVDISHEANETELRSKMINAVVASKKNIKKVATNTNSKEFYAHTVSNYSDDILSGKLYETIPPKNDKKTFFFTIDGNPKYLEEIENTNGSCSDEHAVIKKVLGKQEVFGDLLPPIMYQENELLNTSTEQSLQENKALKRTMDIYLPGEEQLNHHIQLDELHPISTCMNEFERNVSNTENYQLENELLTTSTEQLNDELQPITTCKNEIDENDSNTENYQSATEQSLQNNQDNKILFISTEKTYHENKALKNNMNDIYLLDADVLNNRTKFDEEQETEIIPPITSIEQNEENNLTTEYYQSESEHTYNFFNKIVRKELSNNQINLNELYNDKNISAIGAIPIDNYNQSLAVSKVTENNYNLFTNIQKERKIDSIKMNVSHIVDDKENHEYNLNENVSDVPKKIQNIIELEQDMVNISKIWTPNVRIHVEATEQYENNNILKSIQTENIKTSKLSNTLKVPIQVTPSPFDDVAATLFEAFPPRDVGRTFNDNLADESADIGKALPVSETGPSNRSTVIIIFSSGTAFLFIIISVTIFLISFQRQHGTLDIEMHERNCGKDDLDEEDAQTFAKLLEVQHSLSVVVALSESEECL